MAGRTGLLRINPADGKMIRRPDDPVTDEVGGGVGATPPPIIFFKRGSPPPVPSQKSCVSCGTSGRSVRAGNGRMGGGGGGTHPPLLAGSGEHPPAIFFLKSEAPPPTGQFRLFFHHYPHLSRRRNAEFGPAYLAAFFWPILGSQGCLDVAKVPPAAGPLMVAIWHRNRAYFGKPGLI